MLSFLFLLFFFQEALEGARKVDDGIIYRLNTSIPTTSFKGEVSAADKCKELYEEVRQNNNNNNNNGACN